MTDVAQKPRMQWKGVLADQPRRTRILTAVVLCVCVMTQVSGQLGFVGIGMNDVILGYVLALLCPVALFAFLLGPAAGLLGGVWAGVIMYAHAQTWPLDYQELLFVNVTSSVILLAIVGLILGVLFALILRTASSPLSRIVATCLICVAVSVIASLCLIASATASAAVQAIQPGDMSSKAAFAITAARLGSLPAQIIIDAVLMAAGCIIADIAYRRLSSTAKERSLGWLFTSRLFVGVLITFMVVAAAGFSVITAQENRSADAFMRNDVGYLTSQLANSSQRSETAQQLLDEGAIDAAEFERMVSINDLVDGYTMDFDGTILVAADGAVIASDDPYYSSGSTLQSRMTPATLASIEKSLASDSLVRIAYDELPGIESVQEPGISRASSSQLAFLYASQLDDYLVVMIRPSSLVFQGRSWSMFVQTLTILALLLVMFFIASKLLKEIVVKRIDETTEVLAKITDGDLNARVNIHDSSEFKMLSSGINTTVSTLQGWISEAESRMARELITAKAIQEGSLPREFPPFPEINRFDLYASMKTAREVGGDFYDFFLVGDDRLAFLIADVSGKGIPAALFMMQAKAQIETYLETGMEIGKAVEAANHQLCLNNDQGMFVTMFACMLNYHTGELTYVNAGHNPPAMVHNGMITWLREVSGIPLGLFDGLPYETFTRQLAVKDSLYLYTDGVTEAMNDAEELFGENRLEETLYHFANMNARSVAVGVRRAITEFTLDVEQSDDITMLALRYGVPPEREAIMILPAIDTQLVHVHNFIHEELRRREAPKSVENPLDIAAEELFVNVCRYAYPDATPDNPGEVRIGFEYTSTPPTLTVRIMDDGIPYNPLEKPDAVTPDDIMDVPIGGLGILMAKRSVDDMTYRREGESNILTFKKSW